MPKHKFTSEGIQKWREEDISRDWFSDAEAAEMMGEQKDLATKKDVKSQTDAKTSISNVEYDEVKEANIYSIVEMEAEITDIKIRRSLVDIAKQIKNLKPSFPNLHSVDRKSIMYAIPPCAEKLFVIPRWEKVAPTYGEAVKIVFLALKAVFGHRFYSLKSDGIDVNFIQQKNTVQFWEQVIRDNNDADFMVVPCDTSLFGEMPWNKDMLDVYRRNYGLGIFAIGCIILANPECIGRSEYNTIEVLCEGDTVSDRNPYFVFFGNGFGFEGIGHGYACNGCIAVAIPRGSPLNSK